MKQFDPGDSPSIASITDRVRPLAVGRLGGVRVRSRVHDPVPVRWAPAEEPAVKAEKSES